MCSHIYFHSFRTRHSFSTVSSHHSERAKIGVKPPILVSARPSPTNTPPTPRYPVRIIKHNNNRAIGRSCPRAENLHNSKLTRETDNYTVILNVWKLTATVPNSPQLVSTCLTATWNGFKIENVPFVCLWLNVLIGMH